MQAIEYHLYRVKLIKSAQASLFDSSLTPRDIFEKALSERLSLELRENNVWHIGNVEYITGSGGRFAVGRTTKTTVEKFDSETGNFVEQIGDSGPYTFVYFDARLGLLGIGRRSKVAPDVKSIARKIQKLLSSAGAVKESNVDVRVDFIPDPEGFIQKIYSAYAVRRFKVAFTGPNPIDADEIFQRPMSYYCQKLDAERGHVVVSGKGLNGEAVIAVAKSTAATANDASALIQAESGERPVVISFNGDAKKVLIDVETSKEQALEAIQLSYRGVRE